MNVREPLGTPVLQFVGSGLATFTLTKKLKNSMQQKVLLGVVVILVGIGGIMAPAAPR